MIYLQLFLAFFKIGTFTFGGGYGMISIVRETVLAYGWMSEEELINFIAVAESTPGSIAVNISTFIGSSQAGILGSIIATIGVVLPSFLIILIIAALISNFLKYKGVTAFLSGVRPCVVGMIIATALTMGGATLLSFSKIEDAVLPDIRGIMILILLFGIHIGYNTLKKKKPSPVLMILISAFLGIVFYS